MDLSTYLSNPRWGAPKPTPHPSATGRQLHGTALTGMAVACLSQFQSVLNFSLHLLRQQRKSVKFHKFPAPASGRISRTASP